MQAVTVHQVALNWLLYHSNNIVLLPRHIKPAAFRTEYGYCSHRLN
jgi:diketogulonate reductase-like aldo/keto reductase